LILGSTLVQDHSDGPSALDHRARCVQQDGEAQAVEPGAAILATLDAEHEARVAVPLGRTCRQPRGRTRAYEITAARLEGVNVKRREAVRAGTSVSVGKADESADGDPSTSVVAIRCPHGGVFAFHRCERWLMRGVTYLLRFGLGLVCLGSAVPVVAGGIVF